MLSETIILCKSSNVNIDLLYYYNNNIIHGISIIMYLYLYVFCAFLIRNCGNYTYNLIINAHYIILLYPIVIKLSEKRSVPHVLQKRFHVEAIIIIIIIIAIFYCLVNRISSKRGRQSTYTFFKLHLLVI